MQPKASRSRYGSLDCIVVDGGSDPRVAVVLCHGYGAGGDDLAGLSLEWINMLGEHARALRFVFPAAPQTLAEVGMPDGRAWWPINMAALADIVQAQRFEDLHTQHPPGLDEAAESLQEAVEAVVAELGGEDVALVLGGFSQGAMLTLDIALRRLKQPPACLLQFSGTLICRDVWQKHADRLRDTAVFQSHGTQDPILPFPSAEALRDMLRDAGVDVSFHAFAGPHTIDMEAIAKSAVMLGKISETFASSG